jgi:hypothetical protein
MMNSSISKIVVYGPFDRVREEYLTYTECTRRGNKHF